MINSDVVASRGDTVEWDETITTDSGPVDLTGLGVRFMLKKSYSDANGAALANLTLGSGLTLVGPAANGVVHVKVPPAATSALENRNQVLLWEIQLEQGTDRWSVQKGRWYVTPEVVQA